MSKDCSWMPFMAFNLITFIKMMNEILQKNGLVISSTEWKAISQLNRSFERKLLKNFSFMKLKYETEQPYRLTNNTYGWRVNSNNEPLKACEMKIDDWMNDIKNSTFGWIEMDAQREKKKYTKTIFVKI